jgi:hypothetical protein
MSMQWVSEQLSKGEMPNDLEYAETIKHVLEMRGADIPLPGEGDDVSAVSASFLAGLGAHVSKELVLRSPITDALAKDPVDDSKELTNTANLQTLIQAVTRPYIAPLFGMVPEIAREIEPQGKRLRGRKKAVGPTTQTDKVEHTYSELREEDSLTKRLIITYKTEGDVRQLTRARLVISNSYLSPDGMMDPVIGLNFNQASVVSVDINLVSYRAVTIFKRALAQDSLLTSQMASYKAMGSRHEGFAANFQLQNPKLELGLSMNPSKPYVGSDYTFDPAKNRFVLRLMDKTTLGPNDAPPHKTMSIEAFLAQLNEVLQLLPVADISKYIA